MQTELTAKTNTDVNMTTLENNIPIYLLLNMSRFDSNIANNVRGEETVRDMYTPISFRAHVYFTVDINTISIFYIIANNLVLACDI